jgi:anti-anti-sigma factor
VSNDLTVTMRSTDRTAILELHGKVCVDCEAALRHAFHQTRSDIHPNVLLNLQHADYIDMTGMAVLINLFMEAKKQKQRILISGIRPEFRRLFDLARFSLFVTITDTEESALVGLKPKPTI